MSISLNEPYLVMRSTFSAEEMLQIFDSMTAELFAARPDLALHGSMMVHLFPDLSETHSDPNYKTGQLPGKPQGHSQFTIMETTHYPFGRLSRCRQDFLQYGTHYEWHHFIRNDHMLYGGEIQSRLLADGFAPRHEWWFSHMCPDAHFQRHVDANSPLLRYSFVVQQPQADASIEIGDQRCFFSTGTTYVMDGELPHEVLNSSQGTRIMMLGSIDPAETSGDIISISNNPWS